MSAPTPESKPRDVRDVLNEHPLSSRVIFAIIALVLVLMLVWAIVSLVLVFFSVEEIEVRGESPYTAEEIIEASGIERGNRLYYLGADKREKELLEKYPYLSSVEIISYFPNRTVINVESYERIFVAEHESGYCYLNESFKILELIAPDQETDQRSISLVTSNVLQGNVGEICAFEENELAQKVYRELENFEYFNEITELDVSDKRSISFVFSGRYKIILGDAHNINEKISSAMRVYKLDEFVTDGFAIIDARDEKKVILRYVSKEDLSK